MSLSIPRRHLDDACHVAPTNTTLSSSRLGATPSATASSCTVVSYRIWLTYEMVRGAVDADQLEWSLAQAADLVAGRNSTKRGSEPVIDIDLAIADVLADAVGRARVSMTDDRS